MRWLGLRLVSRAPRPGATELAEQEQSRRQLEAGGLPVNAQRRLAELAGGDGRLFTSDLSVNEFALLHRRGVVPITQVMGSSIFHPGWQNLPYNTWYGYRGNRVGWGGSGGGRGFTQELTSISAAYNHARQRALARLHQEAELAGADAVVGVRLNTGGHDFAGEGTVEFTAVGTAVRLPAPLRAPRVVITDLSGQDYVMLAQDGLRPAGVVGVSTVMYIASSPRQSWVLSSGNSIFSVAGRANQELTDFTEGFYEAREVAIGHLNTQAAKLGARGVVGVSVEQHLREREFEDSNDNTHHDLVVYLHLLGTAITDGHAPLPRPELTPVMPLGRTLL